MQGGMLNWPRSRKRLVVVALDVGLALFSMWVAFTLRLDVLHRPVGAEWAAYAIAPLLAVPTFVHFGLYRAIFRYTGVAAILATGKAVGAYGLMLLPFIWCLYHWEGIPRSLILLQPLIFLLLVSSSRTLGWHWLMGRASNPGNRLLIYGAGTAGAQTAAALASAQQYALLGFIDDDPTKWGRTINGVPVFSSTDAAVTVSRLSVTDILLALPSASRQRRNQIIGQLQSLPVRIRSLPGLADLASGRVTVEDFKDLDIEDLLGREPVAVQADLLARSLAGRVVLVTGAGGSIGSELCRQITLQGPSELLLVEHSEFALYSIHRELASLVKRSGTDVHLVPLLASVCNFERISAICGAHKPAAVYHAAAYKHVPIVEANPGEGIVNNVLGTLNMARAAIDAKVDRFVLISTDKAVRPTNIMGASKRIAEMVLQSLAATNVRPFGDNGDVPVETNRRHTCFSIVRFGNVLGSSGSVVPMFRSQLAEGGPITVTHPEVMRYFMTIPEAVQLVLHAGALADGGDLFVLDMGKPIKILDLAKRMIALSGLTVRDAARPNGDIHIKITGLRPGEKLFEELLIGENPLPTSHPRIIRAREDFMTWPVLEGYLQALLSAASSDDINAMSRMLQLLVPGYIPKSAHQNLNAIYAAEETATSGEIVEYSSPCP
ncbi:nucleoside-diphosphate sugar epimerase/dehydratase [Variovorax sp. J22G21]|uniref:polysaccharide biosynthesis protein n=1 Tax=Variovorax fucosicus TaxID=3053517 RepID=UPI002576F739|nr:MULTISPECIES: nucleoside-diphosphate sugar epimerase/dehydratase [unclassified Variovorax]MDM0039457.1 nucleoside-diphosphate sugar epimerase/dehydratase [Variovorax sp. J22R193]MDM0064232.1 nucleoside-diphosphate sugar epimerase/dehydratase [Variovorax sp. J22G21]